MDQDLQEFLAESGLAPAAENAVCVPLSGGISCDVWRIDAGGRSICVKRALPRLRVAALWEAPVARSTHEWRWMEFAARVAPHAVPKLLAHDPARGLLAMEYFDPARFPLWKHLLLQGEASVATADAVAGVLARLHAASAGDAEIARLFDTADAFYALRIEPYLLEAARRNPHVAAILRYLADRTLNARIALVHGDVSPKNILVGRDGPIFLDAETAWFGDPAFDVAFCLNHLLLKCLARPQWRENYLACFDGFASRYLASVSWEKSAGLERRTLQLLPALLLARVDGKSPVEYLGARDQNFVRELSCRWIAAPPDSLARLAALWRTALSERETRRE
jgi:aminoglycoside phosphotransferase (APT) family kinase protein